MAAANSAQLTWSNLRGDKVHRAALVPFAAVAALGAVAGILLVHLPGWAEGARVLMGALMLAISAQYARRAWMVRTVPEQFFPSDRGR
jgi:uncharacterized membrane protein YfcA